jgi:hypothetical protein
LNSEGRNNIQEDIDENNDFADNEINPAIAEIERLKEIKLKKRVYELMAMKRTNITMHMYLTAVF